jgi:hypothetical protein
VVIAPLCNAGTGSVLVYLFFVMRIESFIVVSELVHGTTEVEELMMYGSTTSMCNGVRHGRTEMVMPMAIIHKLGCCVAM